MTEIDSSLVDQELLARANEKMAAADSRLTAAREGLAAAAAARDVAEAASLAAARGEGATNVLTAEMELEEKCRAVRVAEKIHDAALEKHNKVKAWAALARGAAHSGVYLAGLRGRIAALKKAEAAKALMSEAEADMQAAAAACHQAHIAGHPHIHGLGNRPAIVSGSVAEELAAIAGAGIDLESQNYPWLAYVKSSEPA